MCVVRYATRKPLKQRSYRNQTLTKWVSWGLGNGQLRNKRGSKVLIGIESSRSEKSYLGCKSLYPLVYFYWLSQSLEFLNSPVEIFWTNESTPETTINSFSDLWTCGLPWESKRGQGFVLIWVGNWHRGRATQPESCMFLTLRNAPALLRVERLGEEGLYIVS